MKEGEILKKIVGLLTLAALVFIITGCSGQTKADYTTEEAETAINDGKDIEGKIVDVMTRNLYQLINIDSCEQNFFRH